MARKSAARRTDAKTLKDAASAEIAVVDRHAKALDTLIERMAADAAKFETMAGVRAMESLRSRILTEEGARQMSDLLKRFGEIAKKAAARQAAGN